jgi:hypothetical protein
MYNITPSGSSPIAAATERYGDRLSQQITNTGQQIIANLQRLTANRQIQGLGATLSQLNPASPDWVQQATLVATEYPEAMRDPRGQAIFGMSAKANAQWQAAQRATQQSNLTFGRQVSLENLKTANDMKLEGLRQQGRLTSGVDLSGLNLGLPSREMGIGTDETQLNEAQEMPGGMGAPLFGMRQQGLGQIAASALGPLAEAQQITGVQPSKSQVMSAIAAERTRRNQQSMQEDRQRQQEELAARRAKESEVAADVRAERSDKKLATQLETGAIKTELAGVERDIGAQRTVLNNFIKELAKKESLTEADHAQRAELQGALQALGAERTRLNNLLKAEAKSLSKEEAAAILKETGGDKEKARELARQRGFTL